jgi:hypothetical protein
MTEVELVFGWDYWRKGLEVLTWARLNCPSYLSNGGVRYQDGALIGFKFKDPHDATLFALRWAELVDQDD